MDGIYRSFVQEKSIICKIWSILRSAVKRLLFRWIINITVYQAIGALTLCWFYSDK